MLWFDLAGFFLLQWLKLALRCIYACLHWGFLMGLIKPDISKLRYHAIILMDLCVCDRLSQETVPATLSILLVMCN